MQPEVWTTALAIFGLVSLVALVATLIVRARRSRLDPPSRLPLRRSPFTGKPGLGGQRRDVRLEPPPRDAQASSPRPAPPTPATPPKVDAPPVASASAPKVLEPPISAPDRPADASDSSLQLGLALTQRSLLQRIKSAFSAGETASIDLVLEGLEEALLLADVGVSLTMRLLDSLRAHHKKAPLTTSEQVTDVLRRELEGALSMASEDVARTQATPRVVLFVGVNGVGKTTSIGKLAAHMVSQGNSVMLAAGDTFRAAAAEQLEIWSERAGASFHRGAAGADPAAVIFGAIGRARADKVDVVLADTAGRLHTKVDLMDEIGKVRRAADKAAGGGQAEVWLVVDGTTGQNALQQAREFHRAVGLSGVVLTKLDGTAKGGVVVAIVDDLKVPIRYLGVGEGIDCLRPFDAHRFVAALLTPT